MYQERVETDQAGVTTEEAAPDERDVAPTDAFLAEMARAMQLTADRERERLGAAATTEMTAFVERVRSRGAAEAAQLRRLAEEDVERIGSWSETEIERIHRETERQIEARRARLEEYLVQHSSLIEHEITRIQTAVDGYHAALADFVGRLSGKTDPAAIAELAGAVPPPPNLEKVASQARGELVGGIVEDQARSRAAAADAPAASAADTAADLPAPTGREPVGVMDPLPAAPADEPQRSHEGGTAVRLLRALAPWTAPAERTGEAASHAETPNGSGEIATATLAEGDSPAADAPAEPAAGEPKQDDLPG